MFINSQRSRSWHSQDKRRSMSREDARRYNLQKVKMRFKNITTRIRQIKIQNSSDLTQLGTLMKSGEQIEKMAHQSLEKASLFLSQSKLHNKRVTSPSYQQAKHTLTLVKEFSFEAKNDDNNAASSRPHSLPKHKLKAGKRPIAPSRIKTDETSESDALRQHPTGKNSETQLQQEFSRVKQQSALDSSQQILDDPSPPQDSIKELPTTIEVEPQKLLRQSTSDSSLLRYSSRNHSMRDSLRASPRRNSSLSQQNKKSDSIYPYVAAIIFSVLFLVFIRE